MMGSCRGMSSSHQRSRYVSWYVDSAESPTPVAAALTATATQEEGSHQNHCSGSGSIPLFLLSPPETSGGETNAKYSCPTPQPTFKRTHQVAFTQSHHSTLNIDRAPNSHANEGVGDGSEDERKGNFKTPEADNWSKEDPSFLHLEDESFLLPRSSPVISRRHRRPLSWHGGGTNTSAPSSETSSSMDSPSSASGRGLRLTITSMEDLGSKLSSCHHSPRLRKDKQPRCVSGSPNLFCLQSTGLPRPISGQQGLAEEHRGRGLTNCDAPHLSGLSTSTRESNERPCSGILEFSAETFKTSCGLEKENAHFIVVDMVLEVLEGVKWTLSLDPRTSTTDTHQQTQCKTCTHRHTSSCGVSESKQENIKSKTSHRNTHSSYVHTHQHKHDGNDEAEHPQKTFSVLSTDSGFEDCGGDTTLTQRDSLRNAEWLAQQLVLEFKRSWLPSDKPRCGRQSLRSSLQELPGNGDVVVSSGSLTEEIRLRTRMRGSLSWAPPRFQIIFNVQPTNRRSEVVALQHFLCAGCGTEVEPKYIKKLRYCEYLGRYFCECCHSGSESVIPGRVLSSWDFGRYPVSDFSKELLDSVWHQPLFDLNCIGKTLSSRVKEMDKFRELQNQLLGIKKLLKACRLSGRVITEFEQLPAHLMEQPHFFSMDDLLRLKKGQLVVQARAVLHAAIDHVENCELCLARGFICEFCRERDIIFPFQIDICRRCPVCRACFHKHCFVEKKCPKCARIQARKKRQDGSVECDV